MGDPWAWLAPIRERHLTAPLVGRYAIEPATADDYWALHEAELRAHYPPEAFLDLSRVLGAAARERAARVAESQEAGTLAAGLGPSLQLAYFHHAEHLRAYELRNGMATLTPALRDAGFGAFDELVRQFRGA